MCPPEPRLAGWPLPYAAKEPRQGPSMTGTGRHRVPRPAGTRLPRGQQAARAGAERALQSRGRGILKALLPPRRHRGRRSEGGQDPGLGTCDLQRSLIGGAAWASVLGHFPVSRALDQLRWGAAPPPPPACTHMGPVPAHATSIGAARAAGLAHVPVTMAAGSVWWEPGLGTSV